MAKKSKATQVQVIETVTEAPIAPVKKTLSSRIRELAAEGKTRSEIVKIVSAETGKAVRYQHVRNVLVTPLKKVEAVTV